MRESKEAEQWRSRAGFILATVGAAVGLGNMWRFSYVLGENGGAAFLLAYVACVLVLGVPLMLAEFALGKGARSDAIATFERLAPHPAWRAAGWLGMAAAFLILTYYAVVAGWAYRYLAGYASGTFRGMPREEVRGYFEAFITHPLEPVLWQFVVIATTVGVVAAGIERGIEATNKVLMPLLGAIVVALAAYALTLDGARRGLVFLFAPDWSALARPEVYLAALGQAFFSLGIGMGILLTYASYTTQTQRLAPAALSVAACDTLFSLVAGVAIFPAVFAFGLDPAHGPPLAFVTLPQVFAVLPGGGVVGLAFFLLLSAAALTSAVSLLEVPVAFLVRRLRWTRPAAAAAVGLAAFTLGLPSALGFGLLAEIRPFGSGILEAADHVASDLLLPLSGLLIALFAGWALAPALLRNASGLRSPAAWHAWRLLLRYVVPVLILIVLARGLL
ncbi:MAG: sodium-dependent transporter [Betaproteobacteria bacterium]|nr:sodium-dependent transporter [Betaproteobacteria bacterium]